MEGTSSHLFRIRRGTTKIENTNKNQTESYGLFTFSKYFALFSKMYVHFYLLTTGYKTRVVNNCDTKTMEVKLQRIYF